MSNSTNKSSEITCKLKTITTDNTFKKIKNLLTKKKFEILKNNSNQKIIKYFIYGKKKKLKF